MKTKLSWQQWLTIIVFGLIGQLAWAVENMEFNLFLFNRIGGSAGDIAAMVAWSAAVSTIATLVGGIISDRMGHRRYFLCIGYVVWGIMTALFALISREHTAALFPGMSTAKVLAMTVTIVIVMDCIMSFCGSLANDASFNAWVTETSDETNRGTIEGVLNVFPLLAMLIVAGTGSILSSLLGWPAFFIVIGASVSVAGLSGLLFVPDTKPVQSKEKMNFWESIVYGFRPSVIRENAKFYLCLLGICIFNISVQVFMPYLLIYLEKTLGFGNALSGLVMAVIIIFASICSLAVGRLVDRYGKRTLAFISISLYCIGLFAAGFLTSVIPFIIAGIIMMTGYVSILILFSSAIRDETPVDHVGMFQGIRLLAYVLVPMIIGPMIGSGLINAVSTQTYVNSYGETVLLPVGVLFTASAVVGLLLYFFAFRFPKQTKKAADAARKAQ